MPRPHLQGEPDPGGFRPRVLPPVWAAFAALLIYVVAVLLDAGEVAQLPRELADQLRWPGVAVLVAGTALSTWAAWGFVDSGTPLEPGYVPTHLLTSGPYRRSRNPIYLGMAIGLVGWALFLGQPLAALVGVPLFMAILQRRVIRHEERMLAERFGDEYVAWRSRVRRWI